MHGKTEKLKSPFQLENGKGRGQPGSWKVSGRSDTEGDF